MRYIKEKLLESRFRKAFNKGGKGSFGVSLNYLEIKPGVT